MDKAAKVRWTVLLCALAATIAAILHPVDAHIEQPLPQIVASKAAMSMVAATVHERERAIWIASDEDPFAPRAWVPPPPPAPPAQAPVPVAQATEPAQVAVEQPLPYRFLGQMQDGEKRVLYLGRGEQVLLAHLGDVLESSYKVVAIGEGQVEFESIQSGVRQSLPIPAQ